MLACSLALPLLLYVAGILRVWQRAGVGRGIRLWEAAAFFGGWLVLAVALSPAADEWTDVLLVAHMLQHELLMVVAAPLLAISAAGIASLWALPEHWRRVALAATRRLPIATSWSALTAPLSVFLLHGVALWGWHLPRLYDEAVTHEAVHVLQHLCFFGSALLFWWGIAHGRYRRAGYGVAVFYVFATTLHGGLLGALMTLSPRPWYASYATPHGSNLAPLDDQQLAGLVMWVPAGLIVAAVGLALFAAWLRESDRYTRYRPIVREKVTS